MTLATAPAAAATAAVVEIAKSSLRLVVVPLPPPHLPTFFCCFLFLVVDGVGLCLP